MRNIAQLLLLAIVAGVCGLAETTTFQVTTSSPKARVSFEAGMSKLEDLRFDEAVVFWRTATKQDPKLAVAYALISQFTTDPAEQEATRDKAKELLPRTGEGEQLMIRWIVGAQENDFVPAIAAVNDLVKKFPQDKRLLFMACRWFSLQGQMERTQQLAEAALAVDPNYTPALNQLGYNLSRRGQIDKAIATMEHYVALDSKCANAQDSYAEMLRMAGRFDAALDHYRAALKLDPKFYPSQLGLADTYALMGKYPEARAEYAKAMALASSESRKLDTAMRNAITYVRQGDNATADKLLDELAAQAKARQSGRWEARLLRVKAMYQKDTERGLQLLQVAESALLDTQRLSSTDHDEELSLIWRDRVLRQCAAGRVEAAGKTFATLEAEARTSRDGVVQAAYHVAAGARLLAQKKHAEAVEQLYEDSNNPLAMSLLAQAFDHMKARNEAENIRLKLATYYRPTIEQAVTRTTAVAEGAGK
jgi:predicted Zn-dependent protease